MSKKRSPRWNEPGLVAPMFIVVVAVAAYLPSGPGVSNAGTATNTPLCTITRVERETTTSVACLACHDGSIAPSALPRSSSGAKLGHSIGVTYRESSKSDRRLLPAFRLPSEIILVKGKVECTSCHDGRSRLPNKLAMSNSRSRLCLGCHDL